MVADKNLYSRGQVVEIFLAITDCDTFDWFVPLVTHSTGGDQVRTALYLRMVSLHRSALMTNLVSNRNESYPGGSMRCLQLLAFWLSWVRFHFTNGTNVLKLSDSLLDSLQVWSQGKRRSISAADVEEDADETEDPEIQLASTLVKDFKEAGVADTASGASDGTGIFVQGCVIPQFTETEIFNIPPDVLAADDRRVTSQVIHSNATEAQFLDTPPLPKVDSSTDTASKSFKYQTWSPLEIKNKGNAFFNDGKLVAAGQCYMHALMDLQREGASVRRDDAASPPLSATLCFNVASVLWKLSAMSAEEVEVAVEKADTGYECVHSPTLGQLTAMMTSRASILLGCVDFCERCLSICGGDHKKALYRLSAALLELDRAAEAIDKLDEYFKQQRLLTSSSVGGEDVAALHDMRRKCIARVVLKGGSHGEGVLRHQEAHTAALPQIVGNATSKVLSQLQARRGRIHNSVSHPWDGIIRDEDESAAAEGKRPLTDAGRGINSHACPPLLLYSSLHILTIIYSIIVAQLKMHWRNCMLVTFPLVQRATRPCTD
jgi:hypothetical protein